MCLDWWSLPVLTFSDPKSLRFLASLSLRAVAVVVVAVIVVTVPGVLTVFLALCKMLYMLTPINC